MFKAAPTMSQRRFLHAHIFKLQSVLRGWKASMNCQSLIAILHKSRWDDAQQVVAADV